MPLLHRLPHCKIEMRSRDHRPAHVHVLFSDGREALVYLANLKVEARARILAKELAAALEMLMYVHPIPSTQCSERPAYEKACAALTKHTKE